MAKRLERRKEAENQAQKAEEAGDLENFDKHTRRTVKVTKEHNEECKRLLTLMGIPYINAPCEAESQCALLAKNGHVFAAASEDMDTLTFSSPILLRHLTFSESRKMNIMEIHLDKVLEGLQFTMDQFIDLCILLGCDYCDSIRGIGPTRAVQLIKDYNCIEKVIENLDTTKYKIPENWPFKEARDLFKNPDVIINDDIKLKWNEPDEQGLIDFLVKEKNFNEDRVRKASKKLAKCNKNETQVRLDGFFKVIPKDPSLINLAKRKAEEDNKNGKGNKSVKGKGGKIKKK